MRNKDNKIPMPNFVRILYMNYDAYIVGSTVDKLINSDNTVNDWDIIVPLKYWNQARLLIPKGTPANSFGGFKVNENGIEIDVWTDNIDDYIQNQTNQMNKVQVLQPKYNLLLTGTNVPRTWH